MENTYASKYSKIIRGRRENKMITYQTAKRLGTLEAEYEHLSARNARCLAAEARGALGWGGKESAMGRQVYLARILPALQALADAGDDNALRAALDAEKVAADVASIGGQSDNQ